MGDRLGSVIKWFVGLGGKHTCGESWHYCFFGDLGLGSVFIPLGEISHV